MKKIFAAILGILTEIGFAFFIMSFAFLIGWLVLTIY
jgi:hypothetical protein